MNEMERSAMQTSGRRHGRWWLVLSVVIGLAATLVPLNAAEAQGRTALINGDTASGGATSVEAVQAAANGFTVTVVTGAVWGALTVADFRKYDVLIIGDPRCGDIAPSVLANVAVWTKAVMDSGGNRFTIG